MDKINSKTIELTWDYKTPQEFTETYLKKYYSQSVFGKGTETLLKSRLESYGGIGFGIYTEDKNGKIEQVDFTTDTEYKYTSKSNNIVAIIIITTLQIL